MINIPSGESTEWGEEGLGQIWSIKVWKEKEKFSVYWQWLVRGVGESQACVVSWKSRKEKQG